MIETTFKMRQATLFGDTPQAWRQVAPPWNDRFPVPSMVCPDELQFLHFLTREHYSGRGAVVDCGPLAGGSTFALASGIGGRGVVHSYDVWEFAPGWDQFFPHRSFAVGDDILPEFLKYIAPFRRLILPHKGDLSRQRWSGEPIELLFIDSAKSPDLMRHLVCEFFPHLTVGAFVAHQDYISAECPWIHIAVMLLEEYFEWVDSPSGGTVCARLVRPIAANALAKNYYDAVSTEEGDRLLDRAAAVCVGWERLCVVLAKAHFLASRGEFVEARRIRYSVVDDPYYWEHGVINDMRLVDDRLGAGTNA